MGGKDSNLSSVFGTPSTCGGRTFDAFDFWATINNYSDKAEAIKAASKMMGMDGRKTGNKKNTCAPASIVPSNNITAASTEVAAAKSIANIEEEWKSDLIPLGGIKVKRVQWLWSNYIPLGNYTLMYGEGGQGKSQLSLSMAATVTTGGAWADGSPSPVGEVIIVTGEDSLNDTIVPRLMAAGADITKVFSLQMINTTDDAGKPVRKIFTLADIPNLKRELLHYPNCKLVIIDPISSFMDDADTHRDADVRSLLTPLQYLAEQSNVAILMIGHSSKARGIKATAKVNGSVAFINASRSAFIVAKDCNSDNMVMAHCKCNLAKIQPSLAYKVVPAIVESEDGDIPTSKIEWLGVTYTTADEAVAASESIPTKREDAKEFLQDILSDGDARYVDSIFQREKEKGIGRDSVYAAQKALGIECNRNIFGGKPTWKLPVDTKPNNN